MRKGYYAIYKGKEYHIDSTVDDELVISSVSLEDLENGFKPCKPFVIDRATKETIVCQKIVAPLEVEEVYEIILKAIYKGMLLLVVGGHEDDNVVYLETPYRLPYIPADEQTEIETVEPLIEMGFYGVQPEYGNCWYRKEVSIDDPEIEFIEEMEDVPWFCKMRQNAEIKERQKQWHLKESAIRCGEYVFYKGKEYPAVRTDNKLILRSDSFNDLENGFKPCRPFTCGTPVRQRVVCVKFLDLPEAEETYIIRMHAVYKGMVFNVIDGVEGSNHIILETPYCLLHNPMGEQLEIKNALTEMGFCEGRYEGFGSRYEKAVPVDDSELKIVEERIETDDKFIPVRKKSKVIKCGKYAVYKGMEYPVRQNKDGSITLLSGELEDIDKGFELCKPFIREFTEEEVVCMKHVDISEVDEAYEIRPHAVYKDMYFVIVKRDRYKPDMVTLSTKYMISYNPSGIQLRLKNAIIEREFTDGECKFIKAQNSYSCWYEKRVSISEPELKMVEERIKTEDNFIPVKTGEPSSKYGRYAVYMGKEYISTGLEDGKLVLCSGSFADLNKEFKICKPFIYKYTGKEIICIKYVAPLEAEDYYELTTKVIYDGNEYYAGSETDTEIEIVCVEEGESHIQHDMEMECIADGIYTKWIKKSEAEIKTVKEEILWFKELKQRKANKEI